MSERADTALSASQSVPAKLPCRHDSIRVDGTLDSCCLRCGVDGYWHDGHRHDWTHPSGKTLFALTCLAFHTKGVGVGVA